MGAPIQLWEVESSPPKALFSTGKLGLQRGHHHGEQDGCFRCRHTHWPQAYFPQLSTCINSKFYIWGWVDNGDILLSKEELSSPLTPCRGSGVTAVVNGHSAGPQRENTPAFQISFHHHISFLSVMTRRRYLPRICLPSLFQFFPSFWLSFKLH